MKTINNNSKYSITATIKAMKRGQCFDLPEDAGNNGGISAHSAAKQLGASVIVRRNDKGGFRVFLSRVADGEKRESKTYKVLTGIALPAGGRGRPPGGVLNAPKGGKGKVAKAKKAPAKVAKKPAKASNKAKLTPAKAAPVPGHLAKAAK